MNKKLNTIALATSLASLGFCSLTFGWQTNTNSLVGTGVASNSQPSSSVMLPPIISGEQAVTLPNDNLPPIVTGTLIRQAAAQGPTTSQRTLQSAGTPSKELETFAQGGGLKPLNSIFSQSETPKAPNAYRPPAPVKPKTPGPVARVAKASQGSGTRSVLSSIGQDYANANRTPQDVLPETSQPMADGYYGNQPYAPSVNRDAFGQDDFVQSEFAVPPSANQNYADQGYADPTYFDQTPVAGGCATCGNELVDGACSTCGPAAGYSDGPIIQDYGTFGSVSAASEYLYLDALLMTRAEGDIANSNFGTLNDFDFSFGFRTTYGTRDDSIFGREFSFMVLPGVSQEISRTDPLIQEPFRADQGARLSVITLPISGAPSDAFTGATTQTQRKESDLYSLEFNRVNWGWDLVKTFSGFRFVRFDDSYNVTSTGTRARLDTQGDEVTNATGNTVFDSVNGDFSLDAANTLLGGQIGGELFYDIGYRWSASGFGKFGIFANFNDFDTNYNNDDFNVSSESDSVTLSTVVELGLLAHYQLRTNLRFRGGYNALFIGNVASVADNIGGTSGLFTGFQATDSDDVVFHGFNFGLEFYR